MSRARSFFAQKKMYPGPVREPSSETLGAERDIERDRDNCLEREIQSYGISFSPLALRPMRSAVLFQSALTLSLFSLPSLPHNLLSVEKEVREERERTERIIPVNPVVGSTTRAHLQTAL